MPRAFFWPVLVRPKTHRRSRRRQPRPLARTVAPARTRRHWDTFGQRLGRRKADLPARPPPPVEKCPLHGTPLQQKRRMVPRVRQGKPFPPSKGQRLGSRRRGSLSPNPVGHCLLSVSYLGVVKSASNFSLPGADLRSQPHRFFRLEKLCGPRSTAGKLCRNQPRAVE